MSPEDKAMEIVLDKIVKATKKKKKVKKTKPKKDNDVEDEKDTHEGEEGKKTAKKSSKKPYLTVDTDSVSARNSKKKGKTKKKQKANNSKTDNEKAVLSDDAVSDAELESDDARPVRTVFFSGAESDDEKVDDGEEETPKNKVKKATNSKSKTKKAAKKSKDTVLSDEETTLSSDEVEANEEATAKKSEKTYFKTKSKKLVKESKNIVLPDEKTAPPTTDQKSDDHVDDDEISKKSAKSSKGAISTTSDTEPTSPVAALEEYKANASSAHGGGTPRSSSVQGNSEAEKAASKANKNKLSPEVPSSGAAIDKYRKKGEKKIATSSNRAEQEKVAAALLSKKTPSEKRTPSEKKTKVGTSDKRTKSVKKTASGSSKSSKKKKKKKEEPKTEEPQTQVAVVNEDRHPRASTECSSSKQETQPDKKNKPAERTPSTSSKPNKKKNKEGTVKPTKEERQDRGSTVNNSSRQEPPPSTSPSTMFPSDDILGSMITSPLADAAGNASWDDKVSVLSGLTERALSPAVRQLASALSPLSSHRSPPPVVNTTTRVRGCTAVATVGGHAKELILEKHPKPTAISTDAESVSATAAAMVEAAMAAAEASIAQSKLMTPRNNKSPPTNSKVDDAAPHDFSKTLAAAEACIAQSKLMTPRNSNPLSTNSPPSNNNKADDITLHDTIKLEKSPSNRSDKENSNSETSSSANNTTPLLTVDTSSTVTLSLKGSIASQPQQRDANSVREVDALLSKTRQWLVRHNETVSQKNAVAADADPLATTASDRRVMGNITAKTVRNPENSGIKLFSSMSKMQDSSGKATSSSLMDQLMVKNGNFTNNNTIASSASMLSAASSASTSGPKKSIMEQLTEIRAKQREIEKKQKAKQNLTIRT